MTPNHIYQYQAEGMTNELYSLNVAFFSFFTDYVSNVSHLNEKIVVKTVTSVDYDGTRVFNVFSAWFEDKPFMIQIEAGRSGKDDQKTIITDKETMNKAILYITELFLQTELFDETDPNEDCNVFENFYGRSVESMLNR